MNSPKTTSLTVAMLALRREWSAVLVFAAVGLVLTTAVSFMIPNYYQSVAKLMPPEQQAISPSSTLNVLSGQVPAIGGNALLSTRTPGATLIGVLNSRTLLDDIINRFELRRVYNESLFVRTRAKLQARTHIEEDRKDGIITITVVDRDKDRARAIAAAYIEDLNRLLTVVSTSGARREREFLAGRLADVKNSLEESTLELSRFSSRNAMIDPQKQGSATLDVAGRLEAQLFKEESESSGMRAIYTDDNVRVRAANARIQQLRGQLHTLTGQVEAADGNDSNGNQGFPSVRKLPLLGATYYSLSREMAVKEAIYGTLEKQYELARVQEAKEIPAVKILDNPDLAERKCFPPRGLMIIFGTLVCVLIRCGAITFRSLYSDQQSMGSQRAA